MDILVDLPGIAENLSQESSDRDDCRLECTSRIFSHLATLRQWRREWNTAHSHDVKLVTVDSDDDILSTRLEFGSANRAMEILYYNEALLFLNKLGAKAARETTSCFALRMAESAGNQNLSFVPPHSVEPRLQPAFESLMSLNCATRLLASSDEKRIVVTPAPIAAVYITLMETPELAGRWEQIMARYFVFEDAEVVFAGYMAGLGDSQWC